MKLYLKCYSPPPPKPNWHDPDPTSRSEWNNVFECITNWFCSSHDFNHDDDLIININDISIELEGSNIRYLGPSLRSAASLVYKAYNTALNLDPGETAESTPGIHVYKEPTLPDIPKPYFELIPSDTSSPSFPTKGTIFNQLSQAEKLFAPATTLSQALVWVLQERE